MGLREDMLECINHAAADEGWDFMSSSRDDKIINECARVALFEMKTKLMAFFPILMNLEETLLQEEVNVTVVKQQLKMAMDWIRRWDQDLAQQA